MADLSISNNRGDLNGLADKLKPNEFRVIVIDNTKIGFIVRQAGSDILFYQLGNGEQYIPGKDFVFTLKGKISESNLPKESVTIIDRKTSKDIAKIAIKPFESSQNVLQSLKEFGKYGPLDILFYYSSSLSSPTHPSSNQPSHQKNQHQAQVSSGLVLPRYANKQGQLTAKREGTVIVTLVWPYTAESVQVTGSFAGWKQLYPLHKEGDVLLTRLYLEPGKYQYKFLVDGLKWCYDANKPLRKDPKSNINNEIVVVGKF